MKAFFKLLGVAAAGVSITLCGLFLGYGIYSRAPKEIPRVYAQPVPEPEKTVGAQTVVKYIYSYSDDGEQVFYEEMAPGYLQGLNIEGVKNALRDYEVCELTESRLVVKKNIQGRSNVHYSIGEKDGYVAVFFENGILKEKTATPIEGLDPKIKAEIIKGVTVDGSEELARCLEDIES